MIPEDFGVPPVIYVEAGEMEFVQCGEEFLWRCPVLIDGEEIGELMGTGDVLE